ncbi:hypothetical protein F0Q45_04365 [Mycobacterium simiae]|uniref:Uncharacterized protein n=1 Tax=Mycobacterium simiae TaxID=1784 RepID=A0A5B1BRQ1_MYCSI|nr:hypothetical protein F0Q45_04365 [Mycobacterium simiae]
MGQSAPNDSWCVAESRRSPAPSPASGWCPHLSIAALCIVSGGDHGGPALYPTPRTVRTTVGFSGSFSTLARRR